jgi:hypothetical protein
MRKAYKAAEWAAVYTLFMVYDAGTNSHVVQLGSSKNEDPNLVERMGSSRHASYMASVVNYP